MIPLHEPHFAGQEWAYIRECLDTSWVAGGAFITRFEQAVADYTGATYAVAVSSGTAALHVALLAAGIGRGDRVVVTDLTFIASVNAVLYCGATPLLMDISLQSWQLDLDLLETWLIEEAEKGTLSSVKAILPVHVLGAMGDMDRLIEIAARFNIPVIEDAAEALGSRFRRRHAGTWGLAGTLSFNGNKIISTGGGGMVLTDDEAFARRVRHLINQAKVRPNGYDHDSVGYNYRMPNINAALGLAQMEQLEGFLAKKAVIAASWRRKTDDAGWLSLPISPDAQWNHWLFTCLLPDPQAVQVALHTQGIESRMLWPPVSTQSFCAGMPTVSSGNALYIQSRSLSLPSSVNLKESDLQLIFPFFHAHLPHY